jgi:hypothetical protein
MSISFFSFRYFNTASFPGKNNRQLQFLRVTRIFNFYLVVHTYNYGPKTCSQTLITTKAIYQRVLTTKLLEEWGLEDGTLCLDIRSQ